MILFSALLFFVLTPGILLRIPPTGNKYMVAFFHAVIFAIIWSLIYNWIWIWTHPNYQHKWIVSGAGTGTGM